MTEPIAVPSSGDLLSIALDYAQRAAEQAELIAVDNLPAGRREPAAMRLDAAARLAAFARVSEAFSRLARVAVHVERGRAVTFAEHVASAPGVVDMGDPAVADTLYGPGAQGRVGHDEQCESEYVLGRWTECRCFWRARPEPSGTRAPALSTHACATCTAAYNATGEVGVCVTCRHQCGSPACRGEPAPPGSALARFLADGRWPNGTEHRGGLHAVPSE